MSEKRDVEKDDKAEADEAIPPTVNAIADNPIPLGYERHEGDDNLRGGVGSNAREFNANDQYESRNYGGQMPQGSEGVAGAARNAGYATRDAAVDIGMATRDAAVDFGYATRDAAVDIGMATRDAAVDFGHATRDAAKSFASAVKTAFKGSPDERRYPRQH